MAKWMAVVAKWLPVVAKWLRGTPAKALMPFPWLYCILLMPAMNSPANLKAAGPDPIFSCTEA